MAINPLNLPEPIRQPQIDWSPLARLGEAYSQYRSEQDLKDAIKSSLGPSGIDANKLSQNLFRLGRLKEGLEFSKVAAGERASKEFSNLFGGSASTEPTAPPSGGVASVRNNNPGAMWPGPSSASYGATGSQNISGGNKIATFPDAESGAAAQFDLLNRKYSGMTLADAITKWSGGNNSAGYIAHISRATGLRPDTPITPDLLRGPQGIALAKSMARFEAGGDYPLSDEQWGNAQARVFGRPAPVPATPLPPGSVKVAQAGTLTSLPAAQPIAPGEQPQPAQQPQQAQPAPQTAPVPQTAGLPTRSPAELARLMANPNLPQGQKDIVKMMLQRELDRTSLTPKQKDYYLYKSEGGRGTFAEFLQKTGPQTNVNVGGGSDKQIFDALEKSADSARAAATGLNSIREARNAVKSGGIFGAGADFRLELAKVAAAFGADPTQVVNTETFRSAIAPQVSATMKATVGSTQISNEDRKFAEKASGGSITLDPRSITRLLEIMERANNVILAQHEKKLNTVYPEGKGFDRERALFGVEKPNITQPQTSVAAPTRVRQNNHTYELQPDGSYKAVD